MLLRYALLCLIWGSTWLAIKWTLHAFPPFWGAAIRFALAALCFLPWIWRRRQQAPRLHAGDWRWLMLCAFVGQALNYGLIYWAEGMLSSGLTASIFSVYPLFTILLTLWLLPQEVVTRRQILGAMLGILGVMGAFLDQIRVDHWNLHVVWAGLAVLLAAATGPVALIVIRLHLRRLHPGRIAFHQIWMGALMLMVPALVWETMPRWDQIGTRAIGALFYLAFLGSTLAFALYYHLLEHLGPVALSWIVLITPMVALVLGTVLGGEPLRWTTPAGLVLVGMGLFLARRRFTTVRGSDTMDRSPVLPKKEESGR